MSDDTDDPYAAEDAAYEERVRLWHEENARKWRGRTGLIRLNGRPMARAFAAFKASLPSFRDAERLFAAVEARLGDRAVSDVWAAPSERALLLRDPERPDWFLPQRLLYMRADYRQPDPIPMHVEIPEQIQRIIARKEAKKAQEPEPEPPVVVPLSPGGRPGRFSIHEGAANADITYGDRGEFKEWSLTTGDIFAFSEADTEPFTIDPMARPPRAPPLSLLLRDDVLGDGVALETLADLIVELQPELAERGRAFVPAIQPGNVTGAWTRGLYHLRTAEWEGRVDDGAGWVIIDAWNGTALTTGDTFDAAFDAWRAHVRQVQPLPPVERRAPEPEPEPEPTEVEPPKATENVAFATTGMIRIEIHPPVILDWPEARPENVPAIALPIPARPPVPEALAAAGFTRVIRLYGEQGEVAFAFVRDDERGFTMVGDDAVAAIDLTTLDEDMTRVSAAAEADLLAMFGRRDTGQYPVRIVDFRVWDDLGRGREFRQGGSAWQAELAPRGWGPERRHLVTRVRYLQVE